MKQGSFEKAIALAIVVTGLVTIERKLESVVFEGLNNLFKDKEEPGPDSEPEE